MSKKPFTDWKPYLVPKKYKDNYDRIFKKHKYVAWIATDKLKPAVYNLREDLQLEDAKYIKIKKPKLTDSLTELDKNNDILNRNVLSVVMDD